MNKQLEPKERIYDEVTAETLFRKAAFYELKMSEPMVTYETIAAAQKYNCYISVLIDLNIYPDYIERKGELLKKGN